MNPSDSRNLGSQVLGMVEQPLTRLLTDLLNPLINRMRTDLPGENSPAQLTLSSNTRQLERGGGIYERSVKINNCWNRMKFLNLLHGTN